MLNKNDYGFGNYESKALIPVTQSTESIPLVRQKRRIGFTALLIAVCMIGSAIFGFGGAYFANSLNSTNTVYVLASENDAHSSNNTSNENSAFNQSIVQTSSLIGLSGQLNLEEVVAVVSNSVVEIITETVSTNFRMGQFVSEGAGSGVIVTADGYIVTNHHVIDGAQAIRVRLNDGRLIDAVLIGTDAKTDLAVLKIEADNLQAAVHGDSSTVLVGQTAIAIGNPLGELGGTVTAGIISALDREITIDGETMSLLQTDAAVNPGNSGGGLFNLYGELVGVVNAKSSGSGIEGLGFAIPINTAKLVIDQIIEYGYVRGRIDTGFALIDIQDSRTAMMYRVGQTGLYISASANTDFQSGDRITEVDGHSVSSLTDFNSRINGYNVGDTVEITVVRNGTNMALELPLGELKP